MDVIVSERSTTLSAAVILLLLRTQTDNIFLVLMLQVLPQFPSLSHMSVLEEKVDFVGIKLILAFLLYGKA